ncbi:SemiSWEET transporter [Flavobacteriaceae bacterium MHTCC 0001]
MPLTKMEVCFIIKPTAVEFIGFGAALLTTIAFLPQVYKTWKTKDVSSLSLPMLILFFIGIILWLIYGILIQSPSMIFANSVTVLSSTLLLYFKLKYGKRSY